MSSSGNGVPNPKADNSRPKTSSSSSSKKNKKRLKQPVKSHEGHVPSQDVNRLRTPTRQDGEGAAIPDTVAVSPTEAVAPAAVERRESPGDDLISFAEEGKSTNNIRASTTSNDHANQERHQSVSSHPDVSGLVTERDSLKSELDTARRLLESCNDEHQSVVEALREEIRNAQEGKTVADNSYKTLLGKVGTIKTQLGERLKTYADELSEAQTQLADLHKTNSSLKEILDAAQSQKASLQAELVHQRQESDFIRAQSNTAEQEWSRERDELLVRSASVQRELSDARQEAHELKVVATEERTMREGLSEKVSGLDEQLLRQHDSLEFLGRERKAQAYTIEKLQKALEETQAARKQELRELSDSSQSHVDEARSQLKAAEKSLSASSLELERLQKESERMLPYEREVKEKNLQIGKLRHEAVILNDHLIKALRFLKKGNPEDNVNRHIVTNHILQFLALDRSDPKKFQILQLIAALLGWNDEQREQAGLARPGTLSLNLRIPLSPFRRSPSHSSISTDMMPDSKPSKESLADLWSDFLEREAQEQVSTSRKGSEASTPPPQGTS